MKHFWCTQISRKESLSLHVWSDTVPLNVVDCFRHSSSNLKKKPRQLHFLHRTVYSFSKFLSCLVHKMKLTDFYQFHCFCVVTWEHKQFYFFSLPFSDLYHSRPAIFQICWGRMGCLWWSAPKQGRVIFEFEIIESKKYVYPKNASTNHIWSKKFLFLPTSIKI